MTAPCPTFGFLVTMDPRAELGASARAPLWDDWIALLEARGLYCTGGQRGERLACVVASEASQATENDRLAIDAWLASRPELQHWDVGQLEDLEQDA
jgi:uncharacterized protein YggL (DUF469 family)